MTVISCFIRPSMMKRVTANPCGISMHSHPLGIMVRLLSVWRQQELVSSRASLTGCPQTQTLGCDVGWDRSSPSPLFFSRPSGDVSYQIIPYITLFQCPYDCLGSDTSWVVFAVFIRPFRDAALAILSLYLFVVTLTPETALRGRRRGKVAQPGN